MNSVSQTMHSLRMGVNSSSEFAKGDIGLNYKFSTSYKFNTFLSVMHGNQISKVVCVHLHVQDRLLISGKLVS